MSLKVSCDVCGVELSAQGALVFGPADVDGECTKYHLCAGKCWEDLLEVLTGHCVIVDKGAA
jgi:hypothetical protein